MTDQRCCHNEDVPVARFVHVFSFLLRLYFYIKKLQTLRNYCHDRNQLNDSKLYLHRRPSVSSECETQQIDVFTLARIASAVDCFIF